MDPPPDELPADDERDAALAWSVDAARVGEVPVPAAAERPCCGGASESDLPCCWSLRLAPLDDETDATLVSDRWASCLAYGRVGGTISAGTDDAGWASRRLLELPLVTLRSGRRYGWNPPAAGAVDAVSEDGADDTGVEWFVGVEGQGAVA